jgi:tetratricopeptide (TPR) repeat protein
MVKMDIEYDAATLKEARQQYAKAQSHEEDFEANGNLADIDLAIECTVRALQLLPKGSQKWLVICKYYAWVLALRYKKTRDMEDLIASLGLVNTWLVETSPTNEDRAHMLSEAADRYRKMFTHSKQKVHLEQALSHGYQALSCGFENADRKFYCMRVIAQMKSSMHDAFPDASTYDEMIQAQKDVLKLTESMTDFDKRFESLVKLTYTLCQRFETVETATNAYEVLPYAREWAKMSPDTSADHIAWFPRMITAKCLSFLVDARLEPVDALSEALTVLEEALAMEIPLEERLQIMAEIQNVGWSKFIEQGIDIDFPEKAVQFGRKALSIVPDNHPSKPINQRHLAVALKRHFNYSGDRSCKQEFPVQTLDTLIDCPFQRLTKP